MLTTTQQEPSCDYSANLLSRSSFKNEAKRCLFDTMNLLGPILCVAGILALLFWAILHFGPML